MSRWIFGVPLFVLAWLPGALLGSQGCIIFNPCNCPPAEPLPFPDQFLGSIEGVVERQGGQDLFWDESSWSDVQAGTVEVNGSTVTLTYLTGQSEFVATFEAVPIPD